MRESESRLDGHDSDNEPANKAEPAHIKHRNSLGTKIALALGAAAFFAVIAFIALGGSDDAPPATLNTTAAVTESAIAVDEAGTTAEEAPAAAAPVEDVAPEPAAEEDAVEEAPVDTESPVASSDANTQQAAEPQASTSTDAAAPTDYVRAELPEGVVSPPSPPGAPHRHSVSSGGRLFMRGTVPSLDFEQRLVTAVEAVMGPGNAIAEFNVDPTWEWNPDLDPPVYVEEMVLFETGSAEIAEPFYPVLAPAAVLLQLQPNVVVTIFGHTDSVGSSATNLALSQDRVNAVRDWVISQGGDPERIFAIGRGDTEPIADNATAEGRALNRRVAFEIAGFEF